MCDDTELLARALDRAEDAENKIAASDRVARANLEMANELSRQANAATADAEELQSEYNILRARYDELWDEAKRLQGVVCDQHEKLKIPHPARDFVNEFNDLLKTKNAEIERLKGRLAGPIYRR